jgi:hypothetical protein
MTAYRRSDADHLLVAIADLQADHGRPLDASRLKSVRQAMGDGASVEAVGSPSP